FTRTPSLHAKAGPAVIVLGCTAAIDHAIDGTGAAEAPSPRPTLPLGPPAFSLDGKRPGALRMSGQHDPSTGHDEEGMLRAGTGFDADNAPMRTAARAIGQQATRRPAAHHDIIEHSDIIEHWRCIVHA